jgi:hypothetical protein
MKIIIIGLIGIVVLIGGFFVLNAYIYEEKQGEVIVGNLASDAVMNAYTLVAEGLTFDYPGGEDGYTLSELTVGAGEPVPVRSLRILPTADYEAEQGRLGEGSPAWTLSVYDNTEMLQASVWADRYTAASNIEMAMNTPVERVIGGANAISYRIDGLYPTDVYVITHGGYVFVASASFLDEDSRTYQEREAWIDSFTFVPTPASAAGKIDPRVACESALMYTTFSSGEEAEAFVESCVAGNHPEVIDRYIESLNVDGAVI